MSTPEVNRATSEEVLVVDAAGSVLRGLERLFRDAGLGVTAVSDFGRAQDQISNRFFSVALVDLDTPTAGGGLELLQFAKTHSPLTTVIVMTGRQTFDAAAAAFRAGAHDVIPKTKEAIPYLRERVLGATRAIKANHEREDLLVEVSEVHEEFLKEMMELSRRVTDLEERLLTEDGMGSSTRDLAGPFELLLVDDDPGLGAEIRRALTPEAGWRIRSVQSGGEALDSASQTTPHVLVVKETLPDLPGRMVVKTVKATAPDVAALLFTPPSGTAQGEVKMVEGSRLLSIVPAFRELGQILPALEDVREALRRKTRERRYLQAFRKEHFHFLKRYHLLKQRLSRTS